MPTREFDLVLCGATGFTGALVAQYLTRHESVGRDLRWALHGRNRAKLEAVRAELAGIDPAAAQLPLLVGDALDPAAMAELAPRATAIATTVGPYARYGRPLAAACAKAGTHYCDLTGEAHFVRDLIDQHHDTCRASGAKLVPACGFDSIPSDIGALVAIDRFAQAHGRAPTRVDTYVRVVKGGFSGGTMASQLSISELSADPAVRKVWADPRSLCADRDAPRTDEADILPVAVDKRIDKWTGTFLMAPFNGKVVRRGLSLRYPDAASRPRYREQMVFGNWAQGQAYTTGLWSMNASLSVGWFRRLVTPMLPQPGEGPVEAARKAGRFVFQVVASDGDAQAEVWVRGDQDPGYGSTSGMLSEAALCLARNEHPCEGGVLTPATAMGQALVKRLPRAGVTFGEHGQRR